MRFKKTKQKESGKTEVVKKQWSQVTSGHMREDESKPHETIFFRMFLYKISRKD